MSNYLKITVVTPSYNQGQYLAETIQSVAGQFYPNLEYFIVDGGSTDNSVEVIKAYEKHIDWWVSEKDKGQSHAINKGFARATGDILCWLNSDDMFMPGTFEFVNQYFLDNPNENVLTGECIMTNQEVSYVGSGRAGELIPKYDIELFDAIYQPSTFWRKSVYQTVGPLDENMHFGFDWEWLIRVKKHHFEVKLTDRFLSVYRLHSLHKSSHGGSKRMDELKEILKRHHTLNYKLVDYIIEHKEAINKTYHNALRFRLYLIDRFMKNYICSRHPFFKKFNWDIVKQAFTYIDIHMV